MGPVSTLPLDLFYLDRDSTKRNQIFRLGRDGTTITQITHEPQGGLNGFDISPVDGTVVYTRGDQLVAIDPDDGSRRVLVEDPFLYGLGRGIWSPDGQMIAYAKGNDVYLYSYSTGASSLLLSGGTTVSLAPLSFSPDGKKLIITRVAYPYTAESEYPDVYDFTTKQVIHVDGGGNFQYLLTCLEKINWATNDTFYCYNPFPRIGAILPGLVLVHSEDGSSSPLVIQKNPPHQLVSAPRLGEDGALYYLYGTDDGIFQQGQPRPTLSLVRADADGVTNRVTVRPEAFRVREAFWTPDNAGVVILQMDEKGVVSELLLLPLDPSLPVITLPPELSSIPLIFRWGTK